MKKKTSRPLLLLVSTTVVLFLLGGGLMLRVGAAENPYRQAVLFAEILSLVMENYVDPVEADRLLEGAYEGMLAGLDPHGAYLTAEEVAAWKAESPTPVCGAGISVLKSRMGLRVVTVDPGSSAAEAELHPGDQIRTVDGDPVRTMSLDQARRRLSGPKGSRVKLGLIPAGDQFKRRDVELIRSPRRGRAFEIEVAEGIAVLHVLDLARFSESEVSEELDDVRSRGVDTLLLDLRNLVDAGPRKVAGLAGLFSTGELLRLRDRNGKLVESISSPQTEPAWSGELIVLVNWATAGGAEAVARLAQVERNAQVFGEPTFGLGAEPELLELETGAGLLVSSARWETASGETWNGEGIEPDRVVRGTGDDLAAMAEDQLKRVLEILTEKKPEAKAA